MRLPRLRLCVAVAASLFSPSAPFTLKLPPRDILRPCKAAAKGAAIDKPLNGKALFLLYRCDDFAECREAVLKVCCDCPSLTRMSHEVDFIWISTVSTGLNGHYIQGGGGGTSVPCLAINAEAGVASHEACVAGLLCYYCSCFYTPRNQLRPPPPRLQSCSSLPFGARVSWRCSTA